MPKFSDIPQLGTARYTVNVGWDYLPLTLYREVHRYGLDVNPNFQRGRVWNEAQKISYVEYVLRGGRSGRDIYLNCPGHHFGRVGPDYEDGWYVLVDGKQRIDAALSFLNNEFKIFGQWYYRDYTDRLRFTVANFVWHVADFKTIEEVYQWYIDLNVGGTVHTPTDISKVKYLLDNKMPYSRPIITEAEHQIGIEREVLQVARREYEEEEAQQEARSERSRQEAEAKASKGKRKKASK
jgi:hypothetical protein